MQEQNRVALRARLRAVLTMIMIAALGIAAILTIIEVQDAWRAHTLKEDLKDLYKSQSTPAQLSWLGTGTSYAEEQESGQTCDEESVQFAQTPEINDDFQVLYEKNNDLVGWLTAGEDIDYPVVQRDNEYYLSHNYYGDQDKNGTIFLNEFNVLEPRDSVLLIHGHNMKSGAMFGKLSRYENESYMLAHPLINFRTIYDADDVYYVPVAAFNASMNPDATEYFDVTYVNFETVEEHEAFLAELMERSLWQSPVDVTAEDKLIVLITCSYQHDDGRFMLYCRRLRKDETPESMLAQLGGVEPSE